MVALKQMEVIMTKYKLKRKIKQVEKMTDLEFMKSLKDLGSYEDMTNIISFITSKIIITPDKLQGLLWYAYGWGLTLYDIEIAPLQFFQTPYGPAEININKIYPAWETAIIPYCSTPKLDPKIETLLNATISTYGELSNDELSKSYAWHCYTVPPGDDISARDIYLFFAKYAAR